MKEDTIKGIIIGIVVGAAATAGLTIGTGVTVMKSEAEASATKASQSALVEGYATICAARFQENATPEEIQSFKSRSLFDQQNYIRNNGWATMQGSTEPYRETADVCARRLVQELQ